MRKQMMKKIDLGQGLGLLANVGVIAGIILLVIELQQNNALLSAQTRTAREAVAIDAANIRTTTPELWRAMMREENGESLTAEEEYLLRTWYWGVFRRLQYVYGEYREGLIERADIPTADWAGVLSSGSVAEKMWRESANELFREDFVRFMEDEIINQRLE